MPTQAHRCTRLGLILLIGATVAACSSFDNATQRLAGVVTPYKIDIVQGNFVSREQVEALQPGMGRQQVREILGTPLVTSLFHSDRWEYVFTLKRPNVEIQTRKLTVFFKGDTFERAEGDEMPSESEFVATLGKNKATGAVPVLEATEAQLARFPARAPAPPAPAALAPARTSYPPLE
ncbi:outer membrane protein assembly factor BamE [Simplicispira psychrophila]|uniref:outer membrane protein assembly factor BamE n=1 Tax=Simplicispira psychrophila TaxID=80882 RepID=UPI0004853A3C|nr:outer membrane protein assembly factor BamE [Simplicispira psychrophila]